MKILKQISFAILLILSTLSFTQSTKAQCHIDDWTGLQAFVKSTKGTVFDSFSWSNIPYSLLDTTLTVPPPNCDLSPYFELDNQGRVSKLEIYGGSTRGYIPPEIGKLSNLTNIFIDSYPSGGITGTLPAEIGNLTKLDNLSISLNYLQGCFDSNLRSLCDQLSYPYINYSSITTNNFEAFWEDFCATGKGQCKEFSVIKVQADIETEEGDVYIKDSLHGVILKSENGLCFRVSVKNDGTLITNKVRCP